MYEVGHNPLFGTRDRVQTSFCRSKFEIFCSLSSLVTLKIRSRSPKSNQIFKPSQRSIYEVWPESVIWCKRQSTDKLRWRDPHQKQYVLPKLRLAGVGRGGGYIMVISFGQKGLDSQGPDRTAECSLRVVRSGSTQLELCDQDLTVCHAGENCKPQSD